MQWNYFFFYMSYVTQVRQFNTYKLDIRSCIKLIYYYYYLPLNLITYINTTNASLALIKIFFIYIIHLFKTNWILNLYLTVKKFIIMDVTYSYKVNYFSTTYTIKPYQPDTRFLLLFKYLTIVLYNFYITYSYTSFKKLQSIYSFKLFFISLELLND